EFRVSMIEGLDLCIVIVCVDLIIVNVKFAYLFVLVAWGYVMLLSILAVVLEEVIFRRYGRGGDLARLLLFATMENLGYRQRTVWWRLKAFFTVWQQRQVWGEMTRKGFETARQQVDAEMPRRGVDIRSE